jgi:hypothetical protein
MLIGHEIFDDEIRRMPEAEIKYLLGRILQSRHDDDPPDRREE